MLCAARYAYFIAKNALCASTQIVFTAKLRTLTSKAFKRNKRTILKK